MTAPGVEGAHYAHVFLRVTGLGPGDRTLVIDTTGGIGTADVQLLRARGAAVTAACDRLPQGRPHLVDELGAERVVELAGNRVDSVGGGFDAVLDTTGPVARSLGRRHVRLPLPRADAALAAHLGRLMDRGDYRPVVDWTYSFDELRRRTPLSTPAEKSATSWSLCRESVGAGADLPVTTRQPSALGSGLREQRHRRSLDAMWAAARVTVSDDEGTAGK